ncbi:MAG: BMP family ABC transporter substrate-binding protein [Hespellia sp.]|nr:BMP family ABC transporter substrate-binding protein [Hespellia sp.]
MKKRVISIMLSACMILALAGCGASGGSEKEEGSSQKSGGLKVALIGNQRFGDNGPMDDMASGADRAAEDFGIDLKKIESEPASFEEDIRAMSEEGYDLIITTFNYMSDATALVAQEFPDTKYAAIFQELNSEGEVPIDNLWDAVFRGQTTFYVDGYMAGLATKTNRVGFIVGGEEPGPNAEANGFMRGVRAANPNAEVEFSYASYEDSAKAKEIALAMIDKGCDIIQGDCAAPDAGIIEASNESGKDVFVLSCIMDFSKDSKNFVGTIKMNYGQAVYDAIQSAVDGKFEGGKQGVRDITNEGYYLDWEIYESFADRTDNQEYAEAFKTAIEKGKEIEKQIVDGDMEVEFDPTAPDWNRIKAE